MIEYLEPVSMKFILVTAAIIATVAIADIVLLVKRRGTPRLEGLLPAVDSILVIAGFMTFIGIGIALLQSSGEIARSTILMETVMSEHTQILFYAVSGKGCIFTIKVMISVLATTLIALFLFFVFFEVWFLLRLLYRQYMKKRPVSS